MYERVLEDVIQPEYPSGDSVRVMTMHKTKGLSSKVVIVAGCCDELIPFKNNRLADDECSAAMREQRRLFYVAITRCKEVLVFSYFGAIHPYEHKAVYIGRWNEGDQLYHTRPSPFIDELGPTTTPTMDGAAWAGCQIHGTIPQ